MTTRRKAARPSGPVVVLDPPPAYLAKVPTRTLLQRDDIAARRNADQILDALAAHGISARPTLAEVEAERARRGGRRLVIATEPSPVRVVLPMGPGVSVFRSASLGADALPPVSEEARRNRARIVAHLDGVTVAKPRGKARTTRPRSPLARIASEVGAAVA